MRIDPSYDHLSLKMLAQGKAPWVPQPWVASKFLPLLLAFPLACSSATEGGTADADAASPDSRVVLPNQDGRVVEPGDVLSDTGDAAGDAAETPDVETGAADVNGFDYPCEPMTVESCVTACVSAGHRKCLKEWGPCIPPAEFCGNCTDDDCNGLVNEGCAPNPECEGPIEPECPVAMVTCQEGANVFTGDTLHLSASQSHSSKGPIVKWLWTVQAPAGSAGAFNPGDDVEAPTFKADVAGQYLFGLEVWDDKGNKCCVPAQLVVMVNPYPPLDPEVGCSDGEREGFVDTEAYPQVAGCAGAWDKPGITPDAVVQTCGGKGGDDGGKPEGAGCSTPDMCAKGWHVCNGWQDLAAKSPTGCAGATPPDAKPKSLFFALRQNSKNGSVCGAPGSGFNDVFGCGNLGAGLGPDKSCGPLDRVLASTQPDSCGFNEAEPPLGPWQCLGEEDSHLNEGAVVTKKGCTGQTCSYDGSPVGASDKGGVLCCHD